VSRDINFMVSSDDVFAATKTLARPQYDAEFANSMMSAALQKMPVASHRLIIACVILLVAAVAIGLHYYRH
jgi:hypothetical protein